MEREKLVISKEVAQELLYGDDINFKVIEDKITDKSRWSVHHRIVIQRKSDNKFFSDTYGLGATESQSEQPWEYNEPNFIEVFPVEKTIREKFCSRLLNN